MTPNGLDLEPCADEDMTHSFKYTPAMKAKNLTNENRSAQSHGQQVSVNVNPNVLHCDHVRVRLENMGIELSQSQLSQIRFPAVEELKNSTFDTSLNQRGYAIEFQRFGHHYVSHVQSICIKHTGKD